VPEGLHLKAQGTVALAHYPATAARLVDCTGAGDCLAAGLAHALAAGATLEEAVQLGMRCARVSIESHEVRCGARIGNCAHTPSSTCASAYTGATAPRLFIFTAPCVYGVDGQTHNTDAFDQYSLLIATPPLLTDSNCLCSPALCAYAGCPDQPQRGTARATTPDTKAIVSGRPHL
jgi:pfkB family carbohydrate kinase